MKFTLQMKIRVLNFFYGHETHFGCDNANDFGLILRPDRPEFANNVVCIHILMTYRDLIVNKTFSDKKLSMLRCFPFLSQLKAGYLNLLENAW